MIDRYVSYDITSYRLLCMRQGARKIRLCKAAKRSDPPPHPPRHSSPISFLSRARSLSLPILLSASALSASALSASSSTTLCGSSPSRRALPRPRHARG
ncbi:hypothetical protein BD310DRAFT_927571 [Dichomitus squalens]|uniref:Uncharacterized protein n=1 Tax=Dichomitus squalens TaxID=114155 RepID=A0A4Q9PUH0_9APHY|nr:hypothetical protein BD310DRAFT_927571 [Dichomitus squalens]